MNPDDAKADMIGIDNSSEILRGFSGSIGVVVATFPLVLAVRERFFSPVRLLGRV
jgi:hypothetical protein